MLETKLILEQHARQYPIFKVQDAVKLLHQSEFGCAHLVENEDRALERLRAELELTRAGGPIFEQIGNNYYRLNLSAVETGVSAETLGRFFILSSKVKRGTVDGFEVKIQHLKEWCRSSNVDFSEEDVENCMESLRQRKYSAISHSTAYREAYHPAYRVVDGVFKDYFEVFKKIDVLLGVHSKVTMAIDGNCGSGKSTLAGLIQSVYKCNLFKMDDFYVPLERKTEERLRTPGGNVDYERFESEVMRPLATSAEFSYSLFDCKRQALGEVYQVTPNRLNVIEGSYSMHPQLIDYYNFKLFLTLDEAEQHRRILNRNGEVVYKRFRDQWIPLETLYFDAYKIKAKADLTINTTGLSNAYFDIDNI